MKASSSTVVPRWEYELGGKLIHALLDDDRRCFDHEMSAVGADRFAVEADLTSVALHVAQLTRWSFPLVHIRPSPSKRGALIDTLADSAFADLLDLELAAIAVNRLYQRAFIDPLHTSVDEVSMTTCLAVCSWTLWNQRAAFPRDRFLRAGATYRGVTNVMRVRRFAVSDAVRSAPAASDD